MWWRTRTPLPGKKKEELKDGGQERGGQTSNFASRLWIVELLKNNVFELVSPKCRSCHFVFEISVATVDVCVALVELVAHFQSADHVVKPPGSSGRLPLAVDRISTSFPIVLLEDPPVMS